MRPEIDSRAVRIAAEIDGISSAVRHEQLVQPVGIDRFEQIKIKTCRFCTTAPVGMTVPSQRDQEDVFAPWLETHLPRHLIAVELREPDVDDRRMGPETLHRLHRTR